MAQVTNTYDTYQSKRGRETLSDVIDRLTPEETPFQSMIGRQRLEGTHPEWNLDTLATPNTANKRVQGDIYSFSAITPTSRVGNYTQIMMKEFFLRLVRRAISTGKWSRRAWN